MSVKMSKREIRDLIEEWTWGTLIAVDGNKPYAIELAYASDGEHIYCAFRPGGKMDRCIRKNRNIMFKICDVEKNYSKYRVASVFAKAEHLTIRKDFLYIIRLANTKRGLGLTEAQCESWADTHAAKGKAGGAIRILMEKLSGRAYV